MSRIRDEDVAAVRQAARIDDVVRDVVELRPAGGGSLKGLCPFHDERSPSFQVSPDKGLFYCFGCGEGGDTLDFVMRTGGITFAEAVEKLADRTGIQLRYEQGGPAVKTQAGQRTRLVAVNAAAQRFYAEQLHTPAAQSARDFLSERGFDSDFCAEFGVGYAPASWDSATSQLRSLKYSQAEIIAAGLAISGNRGAYDRFRDRLVWPIRDTSGDVIGFGARKLAAHDDGPKYLNTPETALYHKSAALFGIDRARKTIGKTNQVVVVEGYTDVMACHAAGIGNAVATCGTAFGEGHVRVLRRLMYDADDAGGQIVFTFDGDEAGQRAALRALESDAEFVAQTYIAVAAEGADPCDLRSQQGDEALRSLVHGKVPLVEFAMRTELARSDLATAQGRINALNATAGMLVHVKDPVLRGEYVNLLARWIGVSASQVQAAARKQQANTRSKTGNRARTGTQQSASTATSQSLQPSQSSQRNAQRNQAGQAGQSEQPQAGQLATLAGQQPIPTIEKLAISVMLQYPLYIKDWLVSTEPTAFTHPVTQSLFEAICQGLPALSEDLEIGADIRPYLDLVLAAAADDQVRNQIRRAVVVALPVGSDAALPAYTEGVMAQLFAADVGRRMAPLKAQVDRLSADGDAETFLRLVSQLHELESYRRELLDTSRGEQ